MNQAGIRANVVRGDTFRRLFFRWACRSPATAGLYRSLCAAPDADVTEATKGRRKENISIFGTARTLMERLRHGFARPTAAGP